MVKAARLKHAREKNAQILINNLDSSSMNYYLELPCSQELKHKPKGKNETRSCIMTWDLK